VFYGSLRYIFKQALRLVYEKKREAFRRLQPRQRRKLAHKPKNPRLVQISFHTLRHWKATIEYHRTRDLLYVKHLLGHKNINNTMLYTQLISFQGDEYSSAVAKTLDEARKLVESGFDYVTDVDYFKLFRKRK